MSLRPVRAVREAEPTIEGAGVRLRRAFGFRNTSETDPFLLLDDFRGDRPEDYRAGFPWHPHRGIETITYVLAGTVEHGDSLGHRGEIGAGDVQWMTAGRGIIHQEMPKGDNQGRMHGFQLWANLPAASKMVPPRYRELASADIPSIVEDDGTLIKIVCGQYGGVPGPVEGVAAGPTYLDVTIRPGTARSLRVSVAHTAFAYVFDGRCEFAGASPARDVRTDVVGRDDDPGAIAADNRKLVLFDTGDEIRVRTFDEGVRFLLVSGAPLNEPVAWGGPIVMNTQEELRQAYSELSDGTFLRE
jgi:redox-sensitive bicupin YhaK (pirin superfamily)